MFLNLSRSFPDYSDPYVSRSASVRRSQEVTDERLEVFSLVCGSGPKQSLPPLFSGVLLLELGPQEDAVEIKF